MPQLKRFDYDYESTDEHKKRMVLTEKQKLAIGIVSVLLLTLICFLIGRHSVDTFQHEEGTEYYTKFFKTFNVKSAQEFLKKEINPNEIRDHLKYFTSFSHMAGTPGGIQSTEYVYDTWLNKQKLDSVQKIEYEVLLDYPNENNPNT